MPTIAARSTRGFRGTSTAAAHRPTVQTNGTVAARRGRQIRDRPLCAPCARCGDRRSLGSSPRSAPVAGRGLPDRASPGARRTSRLRAAGPGRPRTSPADGGNVPAGGRPALRSAAELCGRNAHRAQRTGRGSGHRGERADRRRDAELPVERADEVRGDGAGGNAARRPQQRLRLRRALRAARGASRQQSDGRAQGAVGRRGDCVLDGEDDPRPAGGHARAGTGLERVELRLLRLGHRPAAPAPIHGRDGVRRRQAGLPRSEIHPGEDTTSASLLQTEPPSSSSSRGRSCPIRGRATPCA